MQRIQLGPDVPVGRIRIPHGVGVRFAEGVCEEERASARLHQAPDRHYAVLPLV